MEEAACSILKRYTLPLSFQVLDISEARIGAFVDDFNHRRYHESLVNLTPADVCFARGQAIVQARERMKRETINQRRLLHRKAAA